MLWDASRWRAAAIRELLPAKEHVTYRQAEVSRDNRCGLNPMRDFLGTLRAGTKLTARQRATGARFVVLG